ncbi:MAG: J domain-containing protein [Candidatus Latescibacteria bacterium]|nr:J domain-containing protein [Candidatus Latescibacterota bacterium]
MGKYKTITDARNLMELPESATMERIKTKYHELMKKWHPDICAEKREICEEMSKKITDAYRILLDYCSNYEYSFTKEEVDKYLSDKEWWQNRYGDDPIWG